MKATLWQLLLGLALFSLASSSKWSDLWLNKGNEKLIERLSVEEATSQMNDLGKLILASEEHYVVKAGLLARLFHYASLKITDEESIFKQILPDEQLKPGCPSIANSDSTLIWNSDEFLSSQAPLDEPENVKAIKVFIFHCRQRHSETDIVKYMNLGYPLKYLVLAVTEKKHLTEMYLDEVRDLPESDSCLLNNLVYAFLVTFNDGKMLPMEIMPEILFQSIVEERPLITLASGTEAHYKTVGRMLTTENINKLSDDEFKEYGIQHYLGHVPDLDMEHLSRFIPLIDPYVFYWWPKDKLIRGEAAAKLSSKQILGGFERHLSCVEFDKLSDEATHMVNTQQLMSYFESNETPLKVRPSQWPIVATILIPALEMVNDDLLLKFINENYVAFVTNYEDHLARLKNSLESKEPIDMESVVSQSTALQTCELFAKGQLGQNEIEKLIGLLELGSNKKYLRKLKSFILKTFNLEAFFIELLEFYPNLFPRVTPFQSDKGLSTNIMKGSFQKVQEAMKKVYNNLHNLGFGITRLPQGFLNFCLLQIDQPDNPGLPLLSNYLLGLKRSVSGIFLRSLDLKYFPIVRKAVKHQFLLSQFLLRPAPYNINLKMPQDEKGHVVIREGLDAIMPRIVELTSLNIHILDPANICQDTGGPFDQWISETAKYVFERTMVPIENSAIYRLKFMLDPSVGELLGFLVVNLIRKGLSFPFEIDFDFMLLIWEDQEQIINYFESRYSLELLSLKLKCGFLDEQFSLDDVTVVPLEKLRYATLEEDSNIINDWNELDLSITTSEGAMWNYNILLKRIKKSFLLLVENFHKILNLGCRTEIFPNVFADKRLQRLFQRVMGRSEYNAKNVAASIDYEGNLKQLKLGNYNIPIETIMRTILQVFEEHDLNLVETLVSYWAPGYPKLSSKLLKLIVAQSQAERVIDLVIIDREDAVISPAALETLKNTIIERLMTEMKLSGEVSQFGDKPRYFSLPFALTCDKRLTVFEQSVVQLIYSLVYIINESPSFDSR